VTVAFVINISPLRYNYITLKKRIQVLNQKIFSNLFSIRQNSSRRMV